MVYSVSTTDRSILWMHSPLRYIFATTEPFVPDRLLEFIISSDNTDAATRMSSTVKTQNFVDLNEYTSDDKSIELRGRIAALHR